MQTIEDLFAVLDSLFEADAYDWNSFYDDRGRSIPFFRMAPEESLVSWREGGRLPLRVGARVLELGCGPGRNAIWLAQQGCRVDALDVSAGALRWASDRAAQAGVEVNFVQTSIFDWPVPAGGYDLVLDSGCFHHLPPHRRISYQDLLKRALATDAHFALSCFAAGAMGADVPDADLYRGASLVGGVGYTAEDLRSIFGWLHAVELRRMHEYPPDSGLFGVPFLWVALFQRRRGQPT